MLIKTNGVIVHKGKRACLGRLHKTTKLLNGVFYLKKLTSLDKSVFYYISSQLIVKINATFLPQIYKRACPVRLY